MLEWVHAQWQAFLGIGILFSCIPIIAFINVRWKLVPRNGLLHMTTTLGVRYFIGMMAFIIINILSLLIIPSFTIAVPFTVSVTILFAIMIWG